MGGISFGSNPFSSPLRYPNLYSLGSGFGFESASGVVRGSSETGCQDIQHHALVRCQGFEVGFGSPAENMKRKDSSAIRFPDHNPSEILLLALREYISQRNGILEEGWHVELKQSNGGIYATYCAPDGAKFDSVSEVASHLGLAPDVVTNEPKPGSSSLENFHLPRKRKQARFATTNGFTEGKEFLLHAYYKDFFSNSRRVEAVSTNDGNMINVSESGTMDNPDSGSQQSNVSFYLCSAWLTFIILF